MSPAALLRARRLNGPPIVREGVVERPRVLVVDELVVRSRQGTRRLFWGPGGYEERPWGDRP